MNSLNHPNGSAVVHEVLVQQPPVQFGKGLSRLGHDNAVKAVEPQGLHGNRGLPRDAVNGQLAHVEPCYLVAFAQVEFQRSRLYGRQFAMPINKGHPLALGLDEAAQGRRKSVLQVLDAGINLGLRGLGKLLQQQRNRPLPLVVAHYRSRKNLLGLHAVGLLDFKLNRSEAQVLKLGVGISANLRIGVLRRVNELIADLAVAGAELVEQPYRLGLEALESRRKVTL